MIEGLLQEALEELDKITSSEFHRMGNAASTHVSNACTLIRNAIGSLRPSGWRASKYDIVLTGGGSRTVHGIKHEESLLGIHISDQDHADVTHIPSGKRLASFQTLGRALMFVEDVRTLHDWRQPDLNNVEAGVRRFMEGYVNAHG